MRSDTRLLRKLLGSVLIAGWSVAYLALFFGLHMTLRWQWFLSEAGFLNKEAHFAELERSRAQQRPVAKVEAATAATAAIEEKALKQPEPTGGVYWTDFRGRNRDGRYDQTPVRADWPKGGLPQVWREPVGGGYASFVIANGRAFTIEQRRHQEVATAYEMATGRELWAHGWDGEFHESMGGDGPRATPTWNDGRVYALGAAGELRCLDAATGNGSGRATFSRITERRTSVGDVGVTADCRRQGDRAPRRRSGKSVAAYNRLTGEPVWTALDDMQAYTSPMLVTLAGSDRSWWSPRAACWVDGGERRGVVGISLGHLIRHQQRAADYLLVRIACSFQPATGMARPFSRSFRRARSFK